MNKNKDIVIKRNVDEVNESYRRRIWFVKIYNPKTKKELEEAIRLSNIWINALLLHCVYPMYIMNDIKKILKNSKYNKKNSNKNFNKKINKKNN